MNLDTGTYVGFAIVSAIGALLAAVIREVVCWKREPPAVRLARKEWRSSGCSAIENPAVTDFYGCPDCGAPSNGLSLVGALGLRATPSGYKCGREMGVDDKSRLIVVKPCPHAKGFGLEIGIDIV